MAKNTNDEDSATIKATFPVPKKRCPPIRESQVLLWIYQVMKEISSFDFEQYLRDGVVLCKLIETLSDHSKSDYDAGENKEVKKENIERFLCACRAYGVQDEDLFNVEDLLSMQDLAAVTRCLFALGQVAQTKFGAPQLGLPYDIWLEQELAEQEQQLKRAGMPLGEDLYVSHVDTQWVKDKLAKRKQKDAANIRKPPPDPLVNRTPSKPLSELRALFVQN